MEFNLKKILRALLFSTSETLNIKDIQSVITRFHREAEKFDLELELDPEEHPEQCMMKGLMEQVPPLLTGAQIHEAMAEISRELEESGEVYRIMDGPSGYRMTVAPDYAYWVRLMRDEPKPTKLSQAALETMAIVAYRQPVTRSEIEAVRGVSADNAVGKLMELELIEVIGRADLPGRPLQYGTTDKFLEFSGLRSVAELPASDVLTPSQLNEWIREATEKPLSDEDMGLADEEESGEVASAHQTDEGLEFQEEQSEAAEETEDDGEDALNAPAQLT